MANKTFPIVISIILGILFGCGSTINPQAKNKRPPTADTNDTFLFYKLPPADYTLKRDSTHIGYWYDDKRSDRIFVEQLYTKNNKLYAKHFDVFIYADSIFLAGITEMERKIASNEIDMNWYRLIFMDKDTILFEYDGISPENKPKYPARKMYRLPRLTYPRERAVHYFNRCRMHDTTTIFRWVYGTLPAYSRFYRKGDSIILEAYSRNGKLSHHPITKSMGTDGIIRYEHAAPTWQSAVEHFDYDPNKNLLLIKNSNKPDKSDTAKIIYNEDYEYDFYYGDSLFFYGNPDMEEW